MYLQPQEKLTENEIHRGLKYVIGDGLAAEAMTSLTGGAFLVAMALLMGASNFQIGILAALPTFTNIFQLLSIWLVRRYNNRRAIAVTCNLLARFPLIVIGSLPLLFSSANSVNVLFCFLFFYYFFGSIAGPSWNSWMKDLVPENQLGAYFSHRTRLTQITNVVLSILLALSLDYIRKHYVQYQLYAYGFMFIAAGIIGIGGTLVLSKAPEPQTESSKDHIFSIMKRPLQDGNLRSLLVFNAVWAFALNIATPFFIVFLLKSLAIPLSLIIALGIISQLSSILTIRFWGRFADRYSNKTIIAINAPIYIGCFIAWCFVGIYTNMYHNIALLVIIYILSGITLAGINLSITNISLKLAPKEEAIVYLSVQNIFTAFFSSLAPLIGGYLADYFNNRHININMEYGGPGMNKLIRLVELHNWNFLFLIAALVALIALELLAQVKETGEVEKDKVRRIIRKNIQGSLKEYFLIGHLIDWQQRLWSVIKKRMV
jgi:MFS family permease